MLTQATVEALYARNANPVTTLLALESIRCLGEFLPQLAVDPASREARSSVLNGAFLTGVVVATTGIALQHKLAHTVAGCCNLPHAQTHAILLSHTVTYNLPSLPTDLIERLGMELVGRSGLAAQDIVSAITSISQTLQIPCALMDIGMEEVDIDRTAHVAMEKQYWIPRPLEKQRIKELIRSTWGGETASIEL